MRPCVGHPEDRPLLRRLLCDSPAPLPREPTPRLPTYQHDQPLDLSTSPSLATSFERPFVPRLLTSIDGLLLLLAFSYDFAPQQLILVFSVWRQTLAFARLRFSKSLSFPLFPIHTFGEWEHASRNASKKRMGGTPSWAVGRSIETIARPVDQDPSPPTPATRLSCDAPPLDDRLGLPKVEVHAPHQPTSSSENI